MKEVKAIVKPFKANDIPVSYTHLDVYKRQGSFFRFIGRSNPFPHIRAYGFGLVPESKYRTQT